MNTFSFLVFTVFIFQILSSSYAQQVLCSPILGSGCTAVNPVAPNICTINSQGCIFNYKEDASSRCYCDPVSDDFWTAIGDINSTHALCERRNRDFLKFAGCFSPGPIPEGPLLWGNYPTTSEAAAPIDPSVQRSLLFVVNYDGLIIDAIGMFLAISQLEVGAQFFLFSIDEYGRPTVITLLGNLSPPPLPSAQDDFFYNLTYLNIPQSTPLSRGTYAIAAGCDNFDPADCAFSWIGPSENNSKFPTTVVGNDTIISLIGYVDIFLGQAYLNNDITNGMMIYARSL